MFLVLFDCDGTLVDSQHLIVEAMMRTFHRHKLSAPHRDDVLKVIGLSLPQAINRLVAPGEAVRLDDVVETYRNNFAAMRQDPHHAECLFSGAFEAIDVLADREEVLLGIATGKSRRGVDTMLAATGLNGRFVTIQTADDSPSKPDPTMVHRAIAETGVAKENTVVVGDTAYDMA
ncbi:MAG: HAD-IA family hydrolase, partial [Hyphomicrobiales bacterium]|nr:HAD-IA family hydrolase [Hyphomicrobiales bacterium]